MACKIRHVYLKKPPTRHLRRWTRRSGVRAWQKRSGRRVGWRRKMVALERIGVSLNGSSRDELIDGSTITKFRIRSAFAAAAAAAAVAVVVAVGVVVVVGNNHSDPK